MDFFKTLFDFQMKIHRRLYAHEENIKNIDKYTWYGMFIAMILYAIFPTKLTLYFLTIVSVTNVIIMALEKMNLMATSLRNFLLYGTFSETVLFIIALSAAIRIFKNDNYILEYILFTTLLTVTWSTISFLVNNKVATLANLILSTIIGLFLYINDAVFSILPENLVKETARIQEMVGYTDKQLLESSITILLLPFLISNIVATLICAIKGYWIEKYNNNQDITMEEIKKENDDL